MEIENLIPKQIGSVVLLKAIYDKLELSKIADEIVTSNREVPNGTVLEIMVTNRLQDPKAIYQIKEWYKSKGMQEIYGIDPEQLNDDRIGRFLDDIHPYIQTLSSAYALKAAREYDIDIDIIHYDTSSFSVYGDYSFEDESQVEITYGFSKDKRPDLKQIVFGINSLNDGAIPILPCAFSGNTTDVSTQIENLNRLRKCFSRSDFLYIADSKLSSESNFLDIFKHNGKFLCTSTFYKEHKERFLNELIVSNEFKEIKYLPKSEINKPIEEQNPYFTFEVIEKIEDTSTGKVYNIRDIYVKSQSLKKQHQEKRNRNLEKLSFKLSNIKKNINKYNYKTVEQIKKAINKIFKNKEEYFKFFDIVLKEEKEKKFENQNKLNFDYSLNQNELTKAQKLDGVYRIKTNLSKKDYSIDKILKLYKEQSNVEKRIRNLKGPFKVTPIFLENPKRIISLLFIVTLAVMVFSLIERQVRLRLNGKPIIGLLPENRKTDKPTGTLILNAFEDFHITTVIFKDASSLKKPEPLNEIQKLLFNLLNISLPDFHTFNTG